MSKKAKVFIIIGILAVMGIGVTVFFFAENFFFGKFPESSTILANTDVSNKTVTEAVTAMNNAEGLKMTITKDNIAYTVDISSAVKRDFDTDQVKEARRGISFFSYLFKTKVSKAVSPKSVEIDMNMLEGLIGKVLPESKYSTSDAYFDSDWNLIGEVQGDDIDYDLFFKTVRDDISNGVQMDYNAEAFYNHPEVKASDEDMQETLEKVKKYKEMSVTYKFGKKKEVITSEKICSNLEVKKGKLKLKTGWIDDFVHSLAEKYNTYGSTRTFGSTKDGDVEVKGTYIGWQIDEAATVKSLKKALKKLKTVELEPKYIHEGIAFGTKNDIGKTYVEVSLKRQHLWVYVKGKLKLETDVVTGVPNKERMTHPGLFRIFAKQKDRYLGTMAVQGYHTHVDYFMPFNGGEGLHDANWRKKFGGSIYKTGGSHGCVNMPPAMAAKTYDLVQVGTPVVVY